MTGAELVERCREVDPATIPSTVYRTLDVLEELGLVRHGHGADGREEFHVLPEEEHGHLHCEGCGAAWEIGAGEAAELVACASRRSRGFEVDLSHVTIVGRCAGCAGAVTNVVEGRPKDIMLRSILDAMRRPVPGEASAPPERVAPGPGQESVWDYPRPPRVEPVPERLRVVVDGVAVADDASAASGSSRRPDRRSTTSHPATSGRIS